MSEKICPKCDQTKPLDEFHLRNSATGARESWCKSCKLDRVRSATSRQKEAESKIDLKDEAWKSVVDFEGLYSVSSLGRIRSEARTKIRANGRKLTIRPKILKPSIDSSGYHQVRLYSATGDKKMALVHRLVVSAHLSCSLTPEIQVDHINGDKLDNKMSNLRLATALEHSTFTHDRIEKTIYDQGYKDGYEAAKQELKE